MRTRKTGRMMGRIHGIETGYLTVIRVALAIAVVAGVLAVVLAIGWYVFVQISGATSSPHQYLNAPAWESVRHRVLPPPEEQPGPKPTSTDEREAPTQTRRPIDPRINQITDNLNAQFQRNSGQENGFTDRYPKRLIETWAFEDSGLPVSYLPIYVDALIAVSESIGQDKRINRIGSLDSRAQVIMSALDAFRQEFLSRVQRAERRAAAAAISRTEAAARSVYLGLGGLGLLVALALFVVLVRIEVHLRHQTRLLAPAPTQSEPANEQRDHLED